MELSSDRELLVLENQKLVYYLVQKFGVKTNSSEYEDIVSIGTIGLIKAAITFDFSRKNNFSTYASKCINNEILMYYKKENKYANHISLDEPWSCNGEEKEIKLGDIIEDSQSNFIERMVTEDAFIQLISIVLNYLEKKERIIMLYRIGHVSQIDIARRLNIAQGYVSKIITKASKKIKEVINNRVQYKRVFTVEIKGDEYRISFLTKEFDQFNKIFVDLLQNLKSIEILSNFKFRCKGERITLQIPAHPDSFFFIAQIIQEMDDLRMLDG